MYPVQDVQEIFSLFEEEGRVFDAEAAVDAFENHINRASIFIDKAIALLRQGPGWEEVVCTLLETHKARMTTGIEEAYRNIGRLPRRGKAA